MKLYETDSPILNGDWKAAGTTGFNMDVDYRGFRVMMKPSTYLKLATHLPRDRASSADGLKQYIQGGGKVASPFLWLQFPDEWRDDDYSQPAHVVGHEGRNRMYAIMELYGDNPIEVHIIPSYDRGEFRTRNYVPEMLDALNKGIKAERTGQLVQGPLMTKI